MEQLGYGQLYQFYSTKVKQLKKQLNLLGWLRLIVFLLLAYLVYQSFVHQNTVLAALSILLLVLFIFSIRWYNKCNDDKKFHTALADINLKEEQFVTTFRSVYDTGSEFLTEQHAYAYDLDIFDEGGLFAHINRCTTHFGKENLAASFLKPEIENISKRQKAVAELIPKLEFRQNVQAAGQINKSKNKELQQLMLWLQSKNAGISPIFSILIWLMPVLCIGSYGIYLFNDIAAAYSIFIWSFIGNLIIVGLFSKKISHLIGLSNTANKLLRQYHKQMVFIENENFNDEYLKSLQSKLAPDSYNSSQRLGKLVYLLNQLENVLNIFVSIVLNGFLLYHIRILIAIEKWKKENGQFTEEWLRTVGAFEALNSFANFGYNNKENCFPELSAKTTLTATQLGHPLIHTQKRISNDIDFSAERFTILTGSNMSGKSTFLRTVGINLILAKTGSVVCAHSFEFYPFDVFVSMRINDSLQESESLFYAELKRLQSIIEHVKLQPNTFVILDEILRGTNSNDKRNGTISFIKNLMQYQPYGMIATHDTIVADLKNEMPLLVNNKCFESQIIDDQLYFDYKIKDGVCTTLSASFLMKKMGIIQ